MLSRRSGLTRRGRLSALLAGATGQPLEDVLSRIEAAAVAGSLLTPADQGNGPSPRAQVLMRETEENEEQRAELESRRKDLAVKETRLAEELDAVRARSPAWAGSLLWTLLSTLLLSAEAAFATWSIADSAGLDLSVEGLLSALGLGVVGAALVVTFVVAYAGGLVCGGGSIVARAIGVGLLLLCALALAGVRAAAVPESSHGFWILSVVSAVVAGLASGEAKHRVGAFLLAWGSYREELRAARAAFQSTEADLARCIEDLEETICRRRELASALEDLSQQKELLQREVEANKAEARAAWSFGRWLTGGKSAGQEKETHER